MLPDGSRLHVVIPDITRQHWSVNIRKFVLSANTLDELVALGTLTAQAARVPRGRRRRRAQRHRRRRDAGREDDAAELPGRRDPGARAGDHVRGGVRAQARAARRRRDADPAGQPRGHRRDPAAPPGQGGAADAPGPDRRRRGAPGGVPRPADRPELRAAGHVLDPRQLAPARRSSRCARCRCWRARTSATASSCPTVACCVDIVVHTAKDGTGHRRVREIVAVPGRVEGDVVETADLFVTRGDRLVRADGYPPHPERFAWAGIDLPRLLAQERLMGAARRACCSASGCSWSCARAARAPRTRGRARARPGRERTPRPARPGRHRGRDAEPAGRGERRRWACSSPCSCSPPRRSR